MVLMCWCMMGYLRYLYVALRVWNFGLAVACGCGRHGKGQKPKVLFLSATLKRRGFFERSII